MAQTDEFALLNRVAVQQACERLSHVFAWHLDQGSPSTDLADLFTPDGIWELPARDLFVSGRDELVAYFGGFSKEITSRRLCTNVIVEIDGPDTARATSYFTTYRIDGPVSGDGPPTPPPVTQVGYYADEVRRVGGEWLLSRRTTFVTFAAPMPRTTPEPAQG